MGWSLGWGGRLVVPTSLAEGAVFCCTRSIAGPSGAARDPPHATIGVTCVRMLRSGGDCDF